jgi:hypothetical protein
VSMFVCNFQDRFAGKVETGAKRQTIRAERKDGRIPKVGEKIRHYTGMRTKNCRLLCDAVIVSVDQVVVDPRGVWINGDFLLGEDREAFAIADGFENWADMKAWFLNKHGPDFWGLLIKW